MKKLVKFKRFKLMNRKFKYDISIKKVLIYSSIGIFIMFLFVIANTETPKEQVHKERMEYIKNCSFKAQNGIEDYNHCMSKRPDIR